MKIIAADDIPRLYAFVIPGVNWVNPITREDCGRTALFAAMEDYKAGDEITRYSPALIASGPYQNVTREPNDDDRARFAQWPDAAQRLPPESPP